MHIELLEPRPVRDHFVVCGMPLLPGLLRHLVQYDTRSCRRRVAVMDDRDRPGRSNPFFLNGNIGACRRQTADGVWCPILSSYPGDASDAAGPSAYKVMASVLAAAAPSACIIMAYIVMAYIVMASFLAIGRSDPSQPRRRFAVSTLPWCRKNEGLLLQNEPRPLGLSAGQSPNILVITLPLFTRI